MRLLLFLASWWKVYNVGMAFSVFKDPYGTTWPLGYVNVPTIGTPVNIMVNVDSGNNNAPNKSPGQWGSGIVQGEYTPTCHKITFQGVHPVDANNGNGMAPNVGNVYVLRALGPGNQNGGGSQNRSDPGAMLWVIPPGGTATLPAMEMEGSTISPYGYTIDCDNNNEGALVTLLNCTVG